MGWTTTATARRTTGTGDGDGFVDDDPVCGGTDCDDGRGDVNPDGTEICGNEVDEDCSGLLDDRDLDEDGAISGDPSCGGTDCDDSDPRARPGLVESYDLLDNDCNGAVDEGLVPVGSVIVSEVMSAPQAVAAEGRAVRGAHERLVPPGQPAPAGASPWAGPPPRSSRVRGRSSSLRRTSVVFCRETDPALNGGVLCDGRFPRPAVRGERRHGRPFCTARARSIASPTRARRPSRRPWVSP